MIIVNKKFFCFKIIILLCIVALFFAATPIKKLVYPLEYREYIEQYSKEYKLDPYFVMAIISAESRFDESANSHKNAMGLMQITKETAKWCVEQFNLKADAANLYDPETNILIGCAYLNYLVGHFDGYAYTAVAAYNAGQGNVKGWLSDKRYSKDGKTLELIPFDETKEYVEKVEKRYETYKKLYDKRASLNK